MNRKEKEELRKKVRKTRKGDTIPIDDDERFSVLENFIDVFEDNELDRVLMSSLQSEVTDMEKLDLPIIIEMDASCTVKIPIIEHTKYINYFMQVISV